MESNETELQSTNVGEKISDNEDTVNCSLSATNPSNDGWIKKYLRKWFNYKEPWEKEGFKNKEEYDNVVSSLEELTKGLKKVHEVLKEVNADAEHAKNAPKERLDITEAINNLNKSFKTVNSLMANHIGDVVLVVTRKWSYRVPLLNSTMTDGALVITINMSSLMHLYPVPSGTPCSYNNILYDFDELLLFGKFPKKSLTRIVIESGVMETCLRVRSNPLHFFKFLKDLLKDENGTITMRPCETPLYVENNDEPIFQFHYFTMPLPLVKDQCEQYNAKLKKLCDTLEKLPDDDFDAHLKESKELEKEMDEQYELICTNEISLYQKYNEFVLKYLQNSGLFKMVDMQPLVSIGKKSPTKVVFVLN